MVGGGPAAAGEGPVTSGVAAPRCWECGMRDGVDGRRPGATERRRRDARRSAGRPDAGSGGAGSRLLERRHHESGRKKSLHQPAMEWCLFYLIYLLNYRKPFK
jgi:hypothetical protein